MILGIKTIYAPLPITFGVLKVILETPIQTVGSGLSLKLEGTGDWGKARPLPLA
ncbi:MAG: hypothetical protein QGI86_21330 [Candidatus Poribacteria bacterium]|jgi:hypothetical protein|nr:hypothetical protein [Candidatus Poribacteria bacterium]MDP6748432.1 hypothetical protein [Candidatus Poribacteria bacterium]MDP6996835.1 hypothetical protein [Candidatus Poribacteria bacterium]